MKEFRVMARLELINLFGLNSYRYTRDPKEKKKKRIMLIVFGFLGIVLLAYTGFTAYGFADFGLAEKIPMLYVLLAFAFQLGLDAMKAKSLIYRESDLELLIGLPIRGVHVAAARLLRLYVEGLLLTAAFFFPGMIICGIYTGAGVLFYVMILPVILILPILPAAVAAWVGILFAAIISRMRHKVLVEVLLAVIVVIGFFVIGFAFSNTNTLPDMTDEANGSATVVTEKTESAAEAGSDDEKTDEEKKKEQEEKRKAEQERIKEQMAAAANKAVDAIEIGFPPVRILGDAIVQSDLAVLLIYLLISLAVLSVTGIVIGRNFFRISAKLLTVTRHREYHLESMAQQSVMKTLVKKEAARYFSSGVYVANTVIGPVLAVAFSVAAAFFDISRPIEGLKGLPFTVTLVAGVPYLLGFFFNMMAITSSSVSIEGKNWWIPRTLPLSAREILGAKLLFNLIFVAPFYGLSEIIMFFTLRVSFADRLWLLFLPGVSIVFAVLFGMFLNLKFPKFKWENETEVVKQGAAAGLTVLGAFLMLLPGVGAVCLPGQYHHLLNLVILLLISGISCLLYRKIRRFPLEILEV